MTPRGDRDDAWADAGLVQHLLFDWRTRCAARRGPWQLTVSRTATSMCLAVVATLEQGTPAVDLAHTVRAWGAGVPVAAEARAALQCLGEAVAELVAADFGDFQAKGLDPVLEQLAMEAAIPAGRRTVPAVVDQLTGCPDRETLEYDLARVVAATAADAELTVAVLEPDGCELGRHGEVLSVDEGQLLGVLATVRRTFAERVAVYRAGTGSMALIAPGIGSRAMGEHLLRATCSSGPRFFWGRASLQSAGAHGREAPAMLLALAEADLHLRRQDYIAANASGPRRRQLSVVGAAAAALLLVAGTGAALTGIGGGPATHADKAALSAPARSAPHTTAPSVTGPPVSTPPAAPPAASPVPPAAATVSATPPARTPVAAPAVVLTSYETPAPTATPSPPPPPPSPPPSASPPPTPSPQPHHGHSGGSPGQLKKLIRSLLKA